VSPTGDDDAPGTESRPMRTLAAAISKARAGDKPATLILADGRHEIAATIEFTSEDSGLTVRAADGAKPILSGGKRLVGWQRDPAQPHLWRLDLPEARGGNWVFHQLFLDGQRLQRARTPNTGYFRARAELGAGSPIELPFHPGDILPQWTNHPHARLIMLMKWTDLHVPIRAVDTERNVAILPGGPRAPWANEPDARYWIENVPEALDAPGEWRLDAENGVVWLILEDKDPNAAVVVAPRLTTLVRVTGDAAAQKAVEGITFRGLVFAETDYEMPADGLISPQAAAPVRGAFRVQFAKAGVIEDCVFENLGGYALDLGRGAQGWEIKGNEIRGSGAGGIRVGEMGDREPSEFRACRGHAILDNHLHQLGRVFAPAVGVIIFQSGQNRVAHNEINDLYYTAISVGWNWGYNETPCRENIIEFNHLHDIGQGRLSDMGGVYTLGIQRGTVVRNNLIHDVTSYGYGGWGLYTDEGSTGIRMESNVVYRCKSAGFHQHYGRENVIQNNIFAFNLENQLMRSRDEDHVSFFLTNNIVYFDTGHLLGSSWRNNRFVVDRNVYFDARNPDDPAAMRFAGATLEEWRARGHDANSIVADPLFENARELDFRLKPESPALKMGFRPIDLSQVGPRKRGAGVDAR
jgi:hypothetical protein